MISDASPLIFLSKIRALSLLRKIYSSITIPEAVKEEIISDKRDDSLGIAEAIKEKWINVSSIQREVFLIKGKGENAAINLASERKEPLIIDDAQGIKIAESLGIKIFRTTSIILLALKKKIITKKEALDFIKSLVEHGYYISPEYYAQLLEKLIGK